MTVLVIKAPHREEGGCLPLFSWWGSGPDTPREHTHTCPCSTRIHTGVRTHPAQVHICTFTRDTRLHNPQSHASAHPQTHVHTHTNTLYTRMCICPLIKKHTPTSMHAFTHAHTQKAHICSYLHTHPRAHTCMCVCTHTAMRHSAMFRVGAGFPCTCKAPKSWWAQEQPCHCPAL